MRKLPMINWICYAVGYVFIATGIMKLLVDDFKVVFSNLAIPYPNSFLFIVAITEIVCGTLIVSRLYMKQATAPLIFIMLAALFLTKIPILTTNHGFLSFLYEARLDIVMLILLILLWQHVPGKKLN
ncbi:DoxX family membrane protein [Virgibacillus dakarensis]|uniref:Membrane protein n=1 Tax=Lentibacillus populi TaxID=1827502 RepID=A0A9W5TXK1_9BACI|nr:MULTISPECIES: DoxX family protein [Bacillaceae]MBT2218603.1 DoxX family protein [Virgibacillus dakarensis]MTW85735.1 DoxX family membrane protein [Virgibacillus dakarensis]GGB42829.1 putative membrane protein [Lentibacillus populi]